jgi:hypothetical protein
MEEEHRHINCDEETVSDKDSPYANRRDSNVEEEAEPEGGQEDLSEYEGSVLTQRQLFDIFKRMKKGSKFTVVFSSNRPEYEDVPIRKWIGVIGSPLRRRTCKVHFGDFDSEEHRDERFFPNPLVKYHHVELHDDYDDVTDDEDRTDFHSARKQKRPHSEGREESVERGKKGATPLKVMPTSQTPNRSYYKKDGTLSLRAPKERVPPPAAATKCNTQ